MIGTFWRVTTQCEISKDRRDWQILAGNDERIVSHNLSRPNKRYFTMMPNQKELYLTVDDDRVGRPAMNIRAQVLTNNFTFWFSNVILVLIMASYKAQQYY